LSANASLPVAADRGSQDGARSREPLVLLVITAFALVLSAWRPHDRMTWVLEVLPVMLGAPILVATYSRFRLTPLAYRLLFIHALILIVGGHYTYSRVPLGEWVRAPLELSRNHYDRLGHLAQGFIPAIVAREILLRTSPLHSGRWLFAIVAGICLAISALYEFFEWGAAVMGEEAAHEFLGTQGDVWDTQWDMLLALIGACTAQVLLSRLHDRQLAVLARARIVPSADCRASG
jgi:putative membrane protein